MDQLKKDEYDSLGFTKYSHFLSQQRVDRINKIIDDLDLKPGETVFDEDGTGKIKQIQYLHTYHDEFKELIEDIRPLAKYLTGLNGDEEELDVLNMQLFEKHPTISKPTRAHQDNGYFKIEPPIGLTFWLSLDYINEENGALYYAPKTHLTPTRRHQRYHKQTTFRIRSGVLGLSLCLHEHPEETDLLMETIPGDLLVHHCNLVHRAGKNNSVNRRRRAIGLVFIPKKCTEDPRLVKYYNDQLLDDIKLQEYKNPALYRKLKEQFSL